MGDAVISNSFREKLSQNLSSFESSLLKALETLNHRQNQFANLMQNSLDQVDYFQSDDFANLHRRVKNEAMSQVKPSESIYSKNINSFYSISNSF